MCVVFGMGRATELPERRQSAGTVQWLFECFACSLDKAADVSTFAEMICLALIFQLILIWYSSSALALPLWLGSCASTDALLCIEVT